MRSHLSCLWQALGIVCCLFITQNLLANHFNGGRFEWECLGSSQYEVSLYLYRDCDSTAAPTAVTIDIDGCTTSFTAQLNMVSTTFNSPYCPSVTTTCQAGTGYYVVERILYQGIVTMPVLCNDYQLSFTHCCRSSQIGNLFNPNQQNLYIEAHLNNALGMGQCDNSPQLVEEPNLILCQGQTNFRFFESQDVDGDSLVYSLVDCEEGQNNSVDYLAMFSGTHPLSTFIGMTINPETGTIATTPLGPNFGVICLLVEEFRNGVKIGETMSDLQFMVSPNCNPAIPSIVVNANLNIPSYSYFDGVYYDTVYANQILDYDITVGSYFNDSLFMIWDAGIAGANFTINQVLYDSVSANFYWQPSNVDIGWNYFEVFVEERSCPIMNNEKASFSILVLPNPHPPISISNDTTVCQGEEVPLIVQVPPPAAPTITDSIRWSPINGLNSYQGDTVFATPQNTTTYTTTVYYSDGAIQQAQVTINVNALPLVGITGATNTLPGLSVPLSGTANSSGYTFEWFDPQGASLGSGTVNGSSSSILAYLPTTAGYYCYDLITTNAQTGCQTTLNHCIHVADPLLVQTCEYIYVTPTGMDVATGSSNDPTNLQEAIRRCGNDKVIIKIAQGTYYLDSTLQIPNFTTLEGGYLPSQGWKKSSQQGLTVLHRLDSNLIGFPNAWQMIALDGDHAMYFHVQDLTIRTDDASQLGTSTYGLRLSNCSYYAVVRAQIEPGDASAGVAGTNGTGGFNGMDGLPGLNGGAGSTLPDQFAGGGRGGIGGSPSGFGFGGCGGLSGFNPPDIPTPGCDGDSATIGSNAGGGGGGGGSGNVHIITSHPGQPGGGAGGGGIPPGAVGVPFIGQTGVPCSGDGGGAAGATSVGDGADGTNGLNGADAVNATAGSVPTLCQYYTPGQAQQGPDGVGGTGGCGGGGGFAAFPNTGGGGGGAGGGGQGGHGGTGGFGGGASIGIYVHNNGPATQIWQCNVPPGAFGSGGAGGTGGTGGAGGVGGIGGVSGAGAGQPGAGGNGGNGGAGGNGGQGGAGSNGIAQALVIANCAPSQPFIRIDTSFDLAAQPQITATDENCAHREVVFEAPSLPVGNTANWQLGSSGVVSVNNSVANPVSTQYYFPGRYDVEQGADVYAGFHTISKNPGWPTVFTYFVDSIAPDTFQMCVGDSLGLFFNVFEGTVYWDFGGLIPDPGDTNLVRIHNVTNPGTYLITVYQDADCCGLSDPDSIWVVVNDYSNANLTQSTVDVCYGDTAMIEVTGLTAGETVNWNVSNLINTQNNINSEQAFIQTNTNLTAQVTITQEVFAGGQTQQFCPVVDSFTINVRPVIQVTINSIGHVSCNGGNDGIMTLSLSGGTAPFTYQWSNGSTNAFATGLSAGNYCVTVTDSNGCTASNCATVLDPPLLTVSIQVDSAISSVGASDGQLSAITTGGDAPYFYQWSNGVVSSSNIIAGLSAGNYCVTVTDNNGCTATNCYNLTDPPILQLTIQQDSSILCAGDANAQLTASVSSGTAPYNYQWSNGASGATISGLSAGTYCVTVTDAIGNMHDTCWVVNEPPPLLVQIVEDSSIFCAGYSGGQLTAIAAGGTPPYTYTWSIGAVGPTVSGLTPGTYCAMVTDANNCQTVVCQTLHAGATPTITDANCPNLDDGVIAISPNGGTAPYQYLWSNGATDSIITQLTPGNYEVTITGAQGCSWEGVYNVGPFISRVDTTILLPAGDSLLYCFASPANYITQSPVNGQLFLMGIPCVNYFPDSVQQDSFVVLTCDGNSAVYHHVVVDVVNSLLTSSLAGFEVEVFPNPSEGVVTVRLSEALPAQLQLFSATGQLVQSTQINTNQHQLDLSDLPKGVYLLSVETERGRVVKRVVRM